MTWSLILKISHVIISVLLTAAVLLQTPEKGLSGLFGGGGETYHTKRGAEKTLFILTIILALLFSITSTFNFFFN